MLQQATYDPHLSTAIAALQRGLSHSEVPLREGFQKFDNCVSEDRRRKLEYLQAAVRTALVSLTGDESLWDKEVQS